MLSVPCPNCRKLLQVVETATDRESQCPACGTVFRPGSSRAATDAPLERTFEIPDAVDDYLSSRADEPLISTRSVDQWRENVEQAALDRRRQYVRFAVVAFVVLVLFIFFVAFVNTRDVGQAVGAALCCAFVGGLVLVFIVQALPGVSAVAKGLKKAAGRPSQPQRRPRLESEFDIEELP
jgi:phage FluMu protein Com